MKLHVSYSDERMYCQGKGLKQRGVNVLIGLKEANPWMLQAIVMQVMVSKGDRR